MKRLNEQSRLMAQLAEEFVTDALCLLMERQIHGLERILEVHSDKVKDPAQYNVIAGMIERLQYAIPGLYRTPEENLRLQQLTSGDASNQEAVAAEHK